MLAWAVDITYGRNVGAATVKGKRKDLTFAAGLGSVLLIHVKAIIYPIYTPLGISIISKIPKPNSRCRSGGDIYYHEEVQGDRDVEVVLPGTVGMPKV